MPEKVKGDRKRQRITRVRWVGSSEPYGEIEIWASHSRAATVTAAGLPSVEARHPDGYKQGLSPIDATTVLTVGGVRAELSPGSGLSKADRAVRIQLGDRNYIYLVTDRGTEELQDGDGTLLVRTHHRPQTITISTTSEATPTDIALALAFLVLDTGKLTVARTVVGGVWQFFNSPGETT